MNLAAVRVEQSLPDPSHGSDNDHHSMSLERTLHHHPVTTVSLTSLLPPDSPRIDGEDDTHVRLLADSDSQLPPLIVDRETMRVIDGAHRLRAAELRGDDEIAVRFFDGSEADAFVLAVEANTTHGLPLSRADRKAAVERIIASHPQWSDRAIASVAGLAARTVRTIRQRASDDIPQSRTRVGRDGRSRPLDATDGRRRASALLRENTTASLRAIAAEAGVSQGTVRDVRDRLARGEDPVPLQRRRSPDRAARIDGGSRRDTPQLSGRARNSQARGLLLERLKQDPSLRFTEAGRILIRLFEIHSRGEHEWRQLLETVPAHCQGTVAELVHGCADIWQDLVRQCSETSRAEA